jgi:aryl-alcohol dehydrogenase-like predicted oxidoreductase
MRLGRGGIELRPLGLGTNSWNDKSLEGAREALSASLDAGITLIDTAEVYSWGRSERAISQLLRESERPCVVATKFAPLPLPFCAETQPTRNSRNSGALQAGTIVDLGLSRAPWLT